MRTFSVQVITVVLLMLLVTAQGIRLGPVSVSLKTQKKLEIKGQLEKGNAGSNVVPCEDGACSSTLKTIGGTKSEKHVTRKGPADSTSLQKARGEVVKVEDIKRKEDSSIKSNYTESSNEMYPDIIDISGMDYSSARRKPPIHN